MFKIRKQKGNNWWKILVGTLVLILLLADTTVIFSISNIVNRVDKYNRGVVDEIGNVTGNIHKFANDLNEIRGFLLLPKHDYFVNKQNGDQLTGEKKASSASQGIYAFLEQYQKNQNFQQNRNKANKWLTELQNNSTNEFNSILIQAGLQWGKKINTDKLINVKFTNNTGINLFGLILDFQSGHMKVQSILGEKDLGILNDTVLIDYLKTNEEIVKSKQADLLNQEINLNKLMNTEDVMHFLKAKNLIINNVYQNKMSGYNKEIKQNDKVVLSIEIKKPNFVFVLAGQEYNNIVSLQTALLNVLKNLDLRTNTQKIFDAKKSELEQIMKEQAFQDLIKRMHLKVGNLRGENNKIVYDLIDKSDGQVKFSLAVEKSSGHLKLIENNQEIDLENYQINNGLKKNF